MLRFSSSNWSQIYFLLFLELRDEQKVSQRNLYCFPNSRSLTLKEHNTVNSTTNLPTWRHLTNQSMIPESGIMEWRHQSMSPGYAALSPFPAHHWACLIHSQTFSHLTPFFAFFPPLWSLIPGYQAQNWKIVFHWIWNARACKNEVSVKLGSTVLPQLPQRAKDTIYSYHLLGNNNLRVFLHK